MRTTTIVSIAAICGVTATVWSLVVQSRNVDIREADWRAQGDGRRADGGGGGRAVRRRYPDLRSDLEELVTKTPEDEQAWHLLAVARMNEDDEAGARAAWEETVRV